MVREYTSTDNYSFAILLTCLKIGTAVLLFSPLRSSLARNVDLYIFNGNLNGKHWIFGNSRPYVSNDFDGFSTQLLSRYIQLSSHYCKSLGLSELSVRWYVLAETLIPVIVFILVSCGLARILASNDHLRTLSSNGDSVGWILIDLHFSQATYIDQYLKHLPFIG